MKAMKARYLLDLVLTGMIIFELLYQYTGNLLHEVVGAIFGITVIVHVALSHKWIGATAHKISEHKPLKTMHKTRLVLAIALAVLAVLLMVSSIAISHQLSALTGFFLTGTAYDVWVMIHLVSSYAFAAITLVHLAVHWTGALAAFKVPYNPERRRAINASVGTVAALGMMAVAAAAVDPLQQAAAMAAENAAGTNNANTSTKKPYGSGNDAQKPNMMDDLHDFPQDPQGTMPNGDGEQMVPRGKHGKRGNMYDMNGMDGMNDRYTPRSGDSDTQNTRPDDSYGDRTPSPTSPQPPSGNSGNSGSDGSSGSSSGDLSSQICTLCRDRCPLSAPKCDRPYLAGLISR